jgi:lysophospholipase L1-like esterase
LRSLLSRVLLALVAGASAVGCAELALRVAGPYWLDAHMRELRAGRAVLGEDSAFNYLEEDGRRFIAFRPRVNFVLMDREFRTDVHITQWGTRVTGADAAGRDTVVFVGDSFAFGYGVEDHEMFVSHVCRARRIACLDAAFPGSTLSNQLDVVERRYDVWGRPRRIVFVFFAGNDLLELVADRDRSAERPAPVRRVPRVTLYSLNAWVNASPLLRRSYAIQLAKAGLRARLQPDAMDMMFVTATGARAAFADRARTALDAELSRLDSTVQRLGFGAAFVLVPDRYQVYPAAMAAKARYYRLDSADLDMMFPQQLMRDRLTRRGIPWLDVLPCLDPTDETLYYKSDNHLTPRGHDAVARCIVTAATFPL